MLAQQLRLYKPPPGDAEDDDEVVSQVGFAESATPVGNRPSDRFRPKRAAVLICLFEGNNDGSGEDLRVILTKRSSSLSTHSGTSCSSSLQMTNLRNCQRRPRN